MNNHIHTFFLKLNFALRLHIAAHTLNSLTSMYTSLVNNLVAKRKRS